MKRYPTGEGFDAGLACLFTLALVLVWRFIIGSEGTPQGTPVLTSENFDFRQQKPQVNSGNATRDEESDQTWSEILHASHVERLQVSNSLHSLLRY